MSDYTASAVTALPSKWEGFGRLVRKGLGITAFGVQIFDIPPDFTTSSHNESDSGQEELYVGMKGSGWVLIDAEDRRVPLSPDHVVRVGPSVDRTLVSGPEGLRVMIVGATPGQTYEPPDWTDEES